MSEQTEKQEGGAIVAADQPTTQALTTSVMEGVKAAIEKGDVATLNGLLDFQERIMTKQAEIDFNQAMNAMQLEMPVIKKDGSVAYAENKNDPNSRMIEAFKFASFENIMRSVKPIMQSHGFSISFNSAQREGGGAIISATLSHIGGHSETTSFAAALDDSGGKNNVQAMGSTFSYGKRYCVTALLNIVTEGEDDDANTYAEAHIDDEQFATIQNLIDETESDAAAFCKFMKVSSLKEIRQKDYLKATNALKGKRKKVEENG